METSFSLVKVKTMTPKFYSPPSTAKKSKTQEKIILSYPVKPHNLKLRVGLLRASSGGCGKGNAAMEEMERKLEEEFVENCRDGNSAGGIVELMECLEREAIMGRDVGREPMDYNRRAHIFDKSSRVFQALKLSSSSTPASASDSDS